MYSITNNINIQNTNSMSNAPQQPAASKQAVIKFKPTTTGLDMYEHPFNGSQTIETIKQAVAVHYSVDFEQIKLVFKGRILNNRQTAEEVNLANATVIVVINKKTEQPKKVEVNNTIPKVPSTLSTGLGESMPVGFGGYGIMNHPQYMSAISGAVDQEKLDQVMNDPMYMSMMEEMMQDPDTLRSLIQQNPMLKSMFNQNPSMKMILDNPQLMKSVFNPQNLKMAREMMKNQNNPQANPAQQLGQQGSQPMPFPGMGGLGGLGGLGGYNNLGGLTGLYNNMNQQGNTGQQGQAPQMPQMSMPMMVGFNPFAMNPLLMAQAQQQSQQQVPIQQKYKNQLKELQSMGFKDRQQNIKALIESKGDVDGALERLCKD